MQQFQRAIDRRGHLLLQVRRGSRKRLRIGRSVIAEAHKARGLRREVLVDPQHCRALVHHLRAFAGQQVIVHVVWVARVGGRRPGRENSFWSGSGESVDDLIHGRGARNRCYQRLARYVAAHRIAPVLPVRFPGEEEKRLVAHNGAAQRSAKLIQAKRLLSCAVGGPFRQRRVKEIVAQVLEEASVEAVGA